MYSKLTDNRDSVHHCTNCGRTTRGFYYKSGTSSSEFCSEGCARQYDAAIRAEQAEKKAKAKAFKANHPKLHKMKIFFRLILIIIIIGWFMYKMKIA